MTLQAVIFDFDGVIADTESLHLTAYQQVLAHEGVQLSREQYFSQYLGFDDVGLLEQVSRDRGLPWTDGHVTTLLGRKGAAFEALVREGDVLFRGAREFIASAAAAVPIAIASGAFAREIVDIVTAAGIRDLFSTIVGSGDTPESKPSPAPYLLAFERLRQSSGRDLDPQRCVAIEDSRWGLASARGAGLRCVGVTTSYAAHELAGAELVVGGLHELTVARLDELVAQGSD